MRPISDKTDAEQTIARRRRERARKRHRIYTPKQQRIRAACARAYQQKHPDRRRAWRRIHDAVKRAERWLAGDRKAGSRGGPAIIKPLRCRLCDGVFLNGNLRAHHIRDYRTMLERMCSTIWVCRPCHDELHCRMKIQELLKKNSDDVLREMLTEAEEIVKKVSPNDRAGAYNNRGKQCPQRGAA